MRRHAVVLFAAVLLALPGAGSAAAAPTKPPRISPITATFVEAERATHYAITVAGTEQVAWKLTPPRDDPGCRRFSGFGFRAVWHHADSDGCHHLGIDHDGVVEAVVTLPGWRCRAVYLGSETGRGPAPEPCRATAGSAPASAPRRDVASERLLGDIVAVDRDLATLLARARDGTYPRSVVRRRLSSIVTRLRNAIHREGAKVWGVPLLDLLNFVGSADNFLLDAESYRRPYAQAGSSLGRAATLLDRAGEAPAGVVDALRAFARDAKALQKEVDAGRLGEREAERRAGRIEARKRALLRKRFPAALGVSFALWELRLSAISRESTRATIADELDEEQTIAAAERIKRHKQALEAALHRAADKG